MMEECTVCMCEYNDDDRRKCVIDQCKHDVCIKCMCALCMNADKYEWCTKCPLCRTPISSQDRIKYKYGTTRENCTDLDTIIERLKQIVEDPTIACAIQRVRNQPDAVQQATAIEDFYNGRISYMEMRMLAG